MRKQVFAFLFLFACLQVQAQKRHATDEQAIRTVLAAQQDAWNAGRLEAFMLGYWQSDSLQFIGKSGITYGWQKTLDNYKKSYPDTASMGKLQFTLLKIKVMAGTDAYVIGRWQLQRSKGDLSGYFTLLMRKINGRWFIVADHSS